MIHLKAFLSIRIYMCKIASLSNSKLIDEFLKELSIRGLSERRKNKYVILLRKLHFRLIKLSKVQIDRFFFYLRDSKLSDETKADYWNMFRIFVKWLKPKIDTATYILKIRKRIKLPEEILTLEEVRRIILSARSIRYRSMISLLYDSGCRPSELLTLQIKDVIFDDDGLVVLFNGKTGARRIRIITTLDSDKFLKEYLQFNIQDLIFGRMSIERLNQIVKEQAQKIGIHKRVYSYIFRHSRATHLAKHLTEAQMKVYLGWSMSSKMVAVYVHLSGRDMDEKVMELNNNFSAFIPSEGFKQYLFERYLEWKNNPNLNARKINFNRLKI
jgi:integrase